MRRKYDRVYQFKNALEGIRPPIWRRILVPEVYTFWDLHVAIQDAMGWLDDHLHAFEITNPATRQRDTIGIPDGRSAVARGCDAGSRPATPWRRLAGYFHDSGAWRARSVAFPQRARPHLRANCVGVGRARESRPMRSRCIGVSRWGAADGRRRATGPRQPAVGNSQTAIPVVRQGDVSGNGGAEHGKGHPSFDPPVVG